MMSVDEKAREMARQYIPHEGGFSMGGLLQNIIEYFEADVAQLRADRNAAQQRAEQAERERHEARHDAAAYKKRLDYIRLLVGGYVPEAMRTIDLEAPQPAPTVKADEPVNELPLYIYIDRAGSHLKEVADKETPAYMHVSLLHAAMNDILDLLDAMVKRGAS